MVRSAALVLTVVAGSVIGFPSASYADSSGSPSTPPGLAVGQADPVPTDAVPVPTETVPVPIDVVPVPTD
ncbi:MAG: hypothetical protein ABI438_00700, partial [Dermatophilaceae bacterium]